jgi:hypothetical protein
VELIQSLGAFTLQTAQAAVSHLPASRNRHPTLGNRHIHVGAQHAAPQTPSRNFLHNLVFLRFFLPPRRAALRYAFAFKYF